MLEVRNVSVSYGRHRALENASLRVDKGEICVILGANGAGKSTLLKTIGGMARAEPGGAIVMNGKDITKLKAHRIVEEGIALVPEGRGIFGDLTVAENLQLGAFATRARTHEAATLAEIYRLFPRLAERKRQVARTMSGGEQQMVAIGRALMSKPEILMLDEPSLGLSPLLSQELFRALAEIAKTGVGILLVEQNAKQSLKIAGRGYLIENGHVTGENTARALMNDPAVVNAYLGGGTPAQAAKPRVVLPPSIRLPAGLEAMGRAIADLAARAGRIQAAFVRAMRRDADVPSAFVGRYDARAGADPWVDIAADAPVPTSVAMRQPVVSADARRIGDTAAGLSRRAAERLAAHVSATRLSSPRPSAFAAAAAREEPAPTAAPNPAMNGSGSLIGHNSAGLDVEEEPQREHTRPQPVRELSIADLAARAAAIHAAHVARTRKGIAPFAAAPAWSPPQPQAPERPASDAIADLVARASSIHAAHVAKTRKTLTAYTIPARPSLKAGGDEPGPERDKKRKKHKEA